MSDRRFYSVNVPKVISENFDDEVVIVNLEDGNYHSLNQVGAAVWRLVEKRLPVDSFVTHLLTAYEGNKEDIEAAVLGFLENLEEAGLIVPVSGSAAEESKAATALTAGEAKTAFCPPVLQTYTDMQDLLLLDPVHEVDETGWPSRPEKQG